MTLESTVVAAMYESHKSYLWGLGYRLLGTPDDADDVLQETFVRLLEQPPADATAILPWMLGVAVEFALSELRQRRTRKYKGVWLPGPVPDARLEIPGFAPEARHSLVESASYAFLLGLETLDERQRVALVLHDAFGHSKQATATALGVGEAEVTDALEGARLALKGYDESRRPLDAEHVAAAGDVLGRFVSALTGGDRASAKALLTDGVRALVDGGTEFMAPEAPVVGADGVADYFAQVFESRSADATLEVRSFNGLPVLIIDGDPPAPGCAGRAVVRLELDAAGRIREIHSVLATSKLGALWGASAARD